jgi:hypothetical protein
VYSCYSAERDFGIHRINHAFDEPIEEDISHCLPMVEGQTTYFDSIGFCTYLSDENASKIKGRCSYLGGDRIQIMLQFVSGGTDKTLPAGLEAWSPGSTKHLENI